MINQRKKPSKLVWTQAWRRLNKKGKDEGGGRKKSRRAVKAQRAIVGASIEDIKKRRQTPKARSVATDAALKEVKDRKKAAGGAKQYSTGPKGKGNVPKGQKSSASSKSK
jgi:large subunit ribosomal protein L24e